MSPPLLPPVPGAVGVSHQSGHMKGSGVSVSVGYAAAAPVAAYAAAPAAYAPAAYAAAPAAYAAGYGYAGPLHVPTLVAHPNGAVVPADEPAVVVARAEHLAAKGAEYALNAPVYGGVYAAAAPAVYGGAYAAAAPAYAGYAAYAAGYAPYAGLVAHPNGAVVPVDEPAVQAARADHFAAKGAVY